MRKVLYAFLTLMLTAVPAFATVTVSTPSNGEMVGSTVPFVATANTTTCSKGVAAVGIYIDGSLKYKVDGTALNTTLSLAQGWHTAVLQEWDYCGGSTSVARSIDINNASAVHVSYPANGATVGSPASFVASATTTCYKGVASIGLYINNQRINTTSGANLNIQIPLGAGWNSAVVESWDNCGGVATAPFKVDVAGASSAAATTTAAVAPSTGTTVTGLQSWSGWNQWGELPPVYNICSSPCGGVQWSMTQHESATSLTGDGTAFWVGGGTPYSDALFSNPFMGQGSAKLPDTARTLMPNLHNFIYDTYVYVPNAAVAQSLEFDINMYLNGVGMEWGTQCDKLGSGDWDIWNNVEGKWIPTGDPCKLQNGWNHVTFQVQRKSNNDLLYQTIALNGVTYNINTTVAPFAVPSGWYGMTVNYQMDGNHSQTPYVTYLDKFNVTYW